MSKLDEDYFSGILCFKCIIVEYKRKFLQMFLLFDYW